MAAIDAQLPKPAPKERAQKCFVSARAGHIAESSQTGESVGRRGPTNLSAKAKMAQ